jgi:hypothetical protein
VIRLGRQRPGQGERREQAGVVEGDDRPDPTGVDLQDRDRDCLPAGEHRCVAGDVDRVGGGAAPQGEVEVA